MNADRQVMKFFPNTLSESESAAFLLRLRAHFETHGHTYFAVELLDSGAWIGFIGLVYQDYEAPFTPAVDVGWRLLPVHWNRGYASEGAARCLRFARENLGLDRVVSTCPLVNLASTRVMEKIGMKKGGEYLHPKLMSYPALQTCIWYTIDLKSDS